MKNGGGIREKGIGKYGERQHGIRESRGRACFNLLVMALDRFSYKAQFETDPAVCCINTGPPLFSSFFLLSSNVVCAPGMDRRPK